MEAVQKIQAIQVHKDAKPITHSGKVFHLRFCGVLPATRRDGTDMAILYTGWTFKIPDGLVGLVYDLDIMNALSLQRVQEVLLLDNDFKYRTEDAVANQGFFVPYWITGGLKSLILDTNIPYIGIHFMKESQFLNVEIEEKIHIPKPVEENKQEAANGESV